MKKVLFFVVAILIVVAVFPLQNAAAKQSDVLSWGLKPTTNGQPPSPPVGAENLLSQHNGIYKVNTAEKKIWLTFDLGYEAGYTADVLDILKKHDVKALFFLCGNYLKESDLVNRMIAEGHSIGNHTDRHRDLPTLNNDAIKKDISDFGKKFENLFGDTPLQFFRPPQGRLCPRTLGEANAQGLKTLLWSIAIFDWGKTPIDAAKNADKIVSRLHSGAIILLHIANIGTPKMLELLLAKLPELGYKTGTPAEL